MRTQLVHLLSFGKNDWVRLQVLPTVVAAHAGLMGSFNLLRFTEHPDIAYTPDYGNGHMTADPEAVRDRSRRYALLQAAALSVEDSADLIAQVMEECYAEHPRPD